MTPWEVFCAAVARDPAAPRVTFYERTSGPTLGERIELSGKVLLNWASKAANLLLEEFDVEAGATVAIALPASHWRSVYWLLAAWATGAQAVFTDTDAPGETRQTPSTDVRIGLSGDVDVLVTLAALARSATVQVPSGALDEARDLPTFGDQFAGSFSPEPGDEALPGISFRELAGTPAAPRAHVPSPTPTRLFTGVVGGGLVLVRGPVEDEELEALLRQEGLHG